MTHALQQEISGKDEAWVDTLVMFQPNQGSHRGELHSSKPW